MLQRKIIQFALLKLLSKEFNLNDRSIRIGFSTKANMFAKAPMTVNGLIECFLRLHTNNRLCISPLFQIFLHKIHEF